ncbi:hypothetical protein HY643_05095, partial [Candidatus Woesearchaeota archaeon]|nr:hypothetical protein [Candidatus Woesearchaeota archaeon]
MVEEKNSKLVQIIDEGAIYELCYNFHRYRLNGLSLKTHKERFQDYKQILQKAKLTQHTISKLSFALKGTPFLYYEEVEDNDVFLSALIQLAYEKGFNDFQLEEVNNVDILTEHLDGQEDKPIKIQLKNANSAAYLKQKSGISVVIDEFKGTAKYFKMLANEDTLKYILNASSQEFCVGVYFIRLHGGLSEQRIRTILNREEYKDLEKRVTIEKKKWVHPESLPDGSPLQLIFQPYKLKKDQKIGEKDLISIAKKAKEEGSWLFNPEDQTWYNRSLMSEIACEKEGTYVARVYPPPFEPEITTKKIVAYHIHPQIKNCLSYVLSEINLRSERVNEIHTAFPSIHDIQNNCITKKKYAKKGTSFHSRIASSCGITVIQISDYSETTPNRYEETLKIIDSQNNELINRLEKGESI